jgi:hypothetical protein
MNSKPNVKHVPVTRLRRSQAARRTFSSCSFDSEDWDVNPGAVFDDDVLAMITGCNEDCLQNTGCIDDCAATTGCIEDCGAMETESSLLGCLGFMEALAGVRCMAGPVRCSVQALWLSNVA